MSEDNRARISGQSPTDVLMRAIQEFGDHVDRVVVISLANDGEMQGLYSNARSEAEMHGMMHLALRQMKNLYDE